MTADEIADVLAGNVSAYREWLAEQPDVKRIVLEQTNGVRIRIGRKKVEVKPPDGEWADLSEQFPPVALPSDRLAPEGLEQEATASQFNEED